MGGLEVFKVSLHSWQRGANPLPLFYEYPLYYPLPCYLQPPPALFFLFFFHVSLAEGVIMPHLMCYFTQ